MPEQFLPNVFQSRDSPGIWGFDPLLAMPLAFIIVPIAIAILLLALQACGRLLRGKTSGRRATSQPRSRFELLQQPQTSGRRRSTALRLSAHAVDRWRQRRLPLVRRIRALRRRRRR